MLLIAGLAAIYVKKKKGKVLEGAWSISASMGGVALNAGNQKNLFLQNILDAQIAVLNCMQDKYGRSIYTDYRLSDKPFNRLYFNYEIDECEYHDYFDDCDMCHMEHVKYDECELFQALVLLGDIESKYSFLKDHKHGQDELETFIEAYSDSVNIVLESFNVIHKTSTSRQSNHSTNQQIDMTAQIIKEIHRNMLVIVERLQGNMLQKLSQELEVMRKPEISTFRTISKSKSVNEMINDTLKELEKHNS